MSCAIETRLSDFCKIVVTAIRTTCNKSQPKKLSITVANIAIMKVLEKNCYKFKPIEITAMKNFTSSCNVFLNKEATRKKQVRGNQSPFMNKTLSKAIMQRSKLRNLFLNNRTEENRNNYVKQMNLCVTHLRKSKI